MNKKYRKLWMHLYSNLQSHQIEGALRQSGLIYEDWMQFIDLMSGETTQRVVVEVSGGVADVTFSPEGVEILIIDHDNEKEEQEYATCGHCGKSYPESEVNMVDSEIDTCVVCELKQKEDAE